MTDDLNCGKCGNVLKVEKEYVTFKDGKAAYIRCSNADCNNSSRIAWDKVKHLKDNSIKPIVEIKKELTDGSVKPVAKVEDVHKEAVNPVVKIEDEEITQVPKNIKKSFYDEIKACDANHEKRTHAFINMVSFRWGEIEAKISTLGKSLEMMERKYPEELNRIIVENQISGDSIVKDFKNYVSKLEEKIESNEKHIGILEKEVKSLKQRPKTERSLRRRRQSDDENSF